MLSDTSSAWQIPDVSIPGQACGAGHWRNVNTMGVDKGSNNAVGIVRIVLLPMTVLPSWGSTLVPEIGTMDFYHDARP